MSHETADAVQERGGGPEDNPNRKFPVLVIYNGLEKHETVEPDETIRTVLDRAIRIFGPIPQPHTLALFNEAGRELPDSETVRQAGIKPKDRLLLRPSQVRGG